MRIKVPDKTELFVQWLTQIDQHNQLEEVARMILYKAFEFGFNCGYIQSNNELLLFAQNQSKAMLLETEAGNKDENNT